MGCSLNKCTIISRYFGQDNGLTTLLLDRKRSQTQQTQHRQSQHITTSSIVNIFLSFTATTSHFIFLLCLSGGLELMAMEGRWWKPLNDFLWHHCVALLECRLSWTLRYYCDIALESRKTPFRSNLRSSTACEYQEKGALRIADEGHSFLMETSCQRSALDYGTTVYDYNGYNDDESIESNEEDDDKDGIVK